MKYTDGWDEKNVNITLLGEEWERYLKVVNLSLIASKDGENMWTKTTFISLSFELKRSTIDVDPK